MSETIDLVSIMSIRSLLEISTLIESVMCPLSTDQPDKDGFYFIFNSSPDQKIPALRMQYRDQNNPIEFQEGDQCAGPIDQNGFMRLFCNAAFPSFDIHDRPFRVKISYVSKEELDEVKRRFKRENVEENQSQNLASMSSYESNTKH